MRRNWAIERSAAGQCHRDVAGRGRPYRQAGGQAGRRPRVEQIDDRACWPGEPSRLADDDRRIAGPPARGGRVTAHSALGIGGSRCTHAAADLLLQQLQQEDSIEQRIAGRLADAGATVGRIALLEYLDAAMAKPQKARAASRHAPTARTDCQARFALGLGKSFWRRCCTWVSGRDRGKSGLLASQLLVVCGCWKPRGGSSAAVPSTICCYARRRRRSRIAKCRTGCRRRISFAWLRSSSALMPRWRCSIGRCKRRAQLRGWCLSTSRSGVGTSQGRLTNVLGSAEGD